MPMVRLGVECRARTWHVLTEAPEATAPRCRTLSGRGSPRTRPGIDVGDAGGGQVRWIILDAT